MSSEFLTKCDKSKCAYTGHKQKCELQVYISLLSNMKRLDFSKVTGYRLGYRGSILR
jgi:hypothetical protein